MSDYTLSNIDGITQAVTTEMATLGYRVACEVGGQSNAAHGAPPRLIWMLQGMKIEPIVRQPSDGHAIELSVQRWTVRVIGSSYTAAEALYLSLRAALSALFGSEWYAQKPIETKPAPEGITSTSYALDHTVELRVPVYDKIWIHTTLPLSGQATGGATADGTTVENIQ